MGETDTDNTDKPDDTDSSVFSYVKLVIIAILAAPAVAVMAFFMTLLDLNWPKSANLKKAWIIVVSTIIYGIIGFQIWQSWQG